jgi:hypothetical protein
MNSEEKALAGLHGSGIGVERISRFLRIVSDVSNPKERGVMSNDDKLIAVMGYYKPWREWVLYPEPQTVWSDDCLAAITGYLQKMRRPNAKGSATPEDGR